MSSFIFFLFFFLIHPLAFLRDEDLKDLEREMNEMREEENQEEEEQDENTAPRKKYPKSVLDDKFFRWMLFFVNLFMV